MLKVLHDPRRLLLSGQAYGLQGLVLHQNFECIINGVSYDRSPFHNNGVVYGAVSVKGKIGDALSFDGVDDYVTVPNSPSLKDYDSGVTFLVWFKLAQLNVDMGIMSQSKDPYINFWFSGTENKLRYEVANVALGQGALQIFTTQSLSQGVWYHAALTYDVATSTLKGYLNGELQGSAVKTITISPNPNPVVLGSYVGYFKGDMDEVRIYNRALSQAEIKRLMFSEVL